MTEDLENTLLERTSRYGLFKDHARITQDLKKVMQAEPGWQRLAADQRESLEIIAHKIARILNGDPNYADSWHDIAGYAKLVDDRLVKESEETKSPGLFDSVNDRFRMQPGDILAAPESAPEDNSVELAEKPCDRFWLGAHGCRVCGWGYTQHAHAVLKTTPVEDSNKHALQPVSCDNFVPPIFGWPDTCQNCGGDRADHSAPHG